MADPRFIDPTLEPNDRRPGWCYLGEPETVNSGPVGIARFSTLRSWLSQWSPRDSRADGLTCAAAISTPLLCIENSADDAVPQSHTGQIFRIAGSADKTMHVVKGANHYYQGQPDLLDQANAITLAWLEERNLLV
jgi:alpha-beta hydrolase superfamily lysophospholipase